MPMVRISQTYMSLLWKELLAFFSDLAFSDFTANWATLRASFGLELPSVSAGPEVWKHSTSS